MSAVKVVVWLSEAGNFHVTKKEADADTIARALDRVTEQAARAYAPRLWPS